MIRKAEPTSEPVVSKRRKLSKSDGISHSNSSMRILRIAPDIYDKKFPYFREPVQQGHFSLDLKRQFRHDSSQLRAFAPPGKWDRCSLDLRHRYKDMIHRDENIKEYLNDLLRWIKCNKQKFFCHSQCKSEATTGNKIQVKDAPSHDIYPKNVFHSLNTDFVCWRGLLTRLLCIPYENQDDILIAVIRFRGTYFMCEFDTESKKQQNLQATAKQKEMCAWGFKFEQYVTADKNSKVANIESPVNTNMAFCSVARSRLACHSIVFGAEVDCEDLSCKKGNPYVELKTSRLIESQRQHENFCKFKLIKWWAQSFLIGIPRVVCGFRDDTGVVRRLQDYPVHDIPGLVNSSIHKPWKPAVCFNFLEAFLQFVKSNISADNERCVYLFRWQPGSDLTCEKRGDDPEYHFLPEWFTKWTDWDQPCSTDVGPVQQESDFKFS